MNSRIVIRYMGGLINRLQSLEKIIKKEDFKKFIKYFFNEISYFWCFNCDSKRDLTHTSRLLQNLGLLQV